MQVDTWVQNTANSTFAINGDMQKRLVSQGMSAEINGTQKHESIAAVPYKLANTILLKSLLPGAFLGVHTMIVRVELHSVCTLQQVRSAQQSSYTCPQRLLRHKFVT